MVKTFLREAHAENAGGAEEFFSIPVNILMLGVLALFKRFPALPNSFYLIRLRCFFWNKLFEQVIKDSIFGSIHNISLVMELITTYSHTAMLLSLYQRIPEKPMKTILFSSPWYPVLAVRGKPLRSLRQPSALPPHP